MHIIETIDCPLCTDGKISVIVEDNKITSHGVCPNCDRTFSAERLNFAQECAGYLREFMEEWRDTETLFDEVDREVRSFNNLVWDVYFDDLYQIHLDEMGGC